MKRYDAEPHLRGLTDFQLASVDHVIEQFYGRVGAKRFLVADETGLGKTRVAQGVIARAIETLQDEPSIERIDVVYVCSNEDLAKQNLRRLNVTGQAEIPFSSRLTLLAEHSRRLRQTGSTGKPINLVSFTPGTSFDPGHQLGKSRERAMILLAMRELVELDGWGQRAIRRLLQGNVQKIERFDWKVDDLQRQIGPEGLDPAILEQFENLISAGGSESLKARFIQMIAEIGRRDSVPSHLHDGHRRLVGELRGALAASSVHTLEPDLVILDEFQRFRHLLDPSTPAGELAHHLFEYDAAKVLLLSATPYKPFTYAEEKEEDHAKDLYNTLTFLAHGRGDVSVDTIRIRLKEYRDLVSSGVGEASVVDALRHDLLKLMSRAERPALPDGSMTVEHRRPADDVRAADLVGFVRLQEVGRLVAREKDRGLVTAEFWKSAPYFINFADGYQFGRRLDEASPSSDLRRAVAATQRIHTAAIEKFKPLDPGNARMRALTDDTVGQGWWQLLWVPPSLPYFLPGGAYADPAASSMTKRLVFSSWAATPAAVAGILSFEAERHAAAGSNYDVYTPEARKRIVKHLNYSVTQQTGRLHGMPTLMLHWPFLALAKAIDPLQIVAERGGRQVSAADARSDVRTRLLAMLDIEPGLSHADSDGDESGLRVAQWRAAFSMAGNWPATMRDDEVALALSGAAESDDDDESAGATVRHAGVLQHLQHVRDELAAPERPLDHETADLLAEIALFAPGSIAVRVLHRLCHDFDNVTERGLFEAAATLANGLRSLFNRPDVTKIVERLGAERTPYWRKVLTYCANGNLEAVLDEYLHHLQADLVVGDFDDAKIGRLASEAAAAIGLKPSTYRAKDPAATSVPLSFVGRFALRYGARDQKAEDARQPEVRRSFNSPFWPMVLASTSVGQEGIDFHWWCHAIFHWNTPPNPVDFEQREGRVDRYRGHAVRKNVAGRHGPAALAEVGGNPWDRLYELATDYRHEYGDFTPGWVYPGPAKIERHVAPFLLSSDEARYDKVKADVALYRLTFGQPRQEDMLELMRKRGLEGETGISALRIDLRPVASPEEADPYG